MANTEKVVVPGALPSVKIKYSDYGSVVGVEINGVAIPGIRSLNLENSANELSNLTLDIICGEVTIEKVYPTPVPHYPSPSKKKAMKKKAKAKAMKKKTKAKSKKKKTKKKFKKPAPPNNDDDGRWDHI